MRAVGRATLAALGSLCLLAAACGHTGNFVWVDELPPEDRVMDGYRIQIGDVLGIGVWNQPNLSGEVVVRSDGRTTIPLLGDIAAAGLRPAGLAQQLERQLQPYVREPSVTVKVKAPRKPMVSVIGEVRRVGEYPLEQHDGLLELIARAGGLTEFANPNHIYVIRRFPRPVRIRFTMSRLSQELGSALAFTPRDGDVVVVE